jgi:hypothetical protein
VDALLQAYREQREGISSMDRADAVIPLAEAYAVIGDSGQALEMYKLALRDGSENPNARVRAIDLAALSSSMAVHGVMPDAQLRARMKEVRNGLSDPW